MPTFIFNDFQDIRKTSEAFYSQMALQEQTYILEGFVLSLSSINNKAEIGFIIYFGYPFVHNQVSNLNLTKKKGEMDRGRRHLKK